MKFLFAHQNFPGQFRYLAIALAKRGHQVIAIGEDKNLTQRGLVHGVTIIGYPTPADAAPQTHHYLTSTEAAIKRGQVTARVAMALRTQHGFVPDMIIGHGGWGDTLFLKDIYPEAKLMSYFEFFYRPVGLDCDFDPEYPLDLDDRCRLHIRNSVNLLTLAASDAGLSPTVWQRSTYPAEFRSTIHVVHDGVDTKRIQPNPSARYTLPNGVSIQAGDEIVTVVNRHLEPYRGFHVLMRALPEILAQRPKAQVVIVGTDGVGYGKMRTDGRTHREAMLAEIGDTIDRQRVHFIGRVPYDDLITLFQVSMAHVYLTYPFVLSWSMIEAMAAGALIIGSATPPVQEVITADDNGLLVDFFDVQGLADTVVKALQTPTAMTELRRRARQTAIDRYDLETLCLPTQLAWINKNLAY